MKSEAMMISTFISQIQVLDCFCQKAPDENVKLAINWWAWVNEGMCVSQLNDVDKIS